MSQSNLRLRIGELWRQAQKAFGILTRYPVILPLAFITLLCESSYSGVNNIAFPSYVGTLHLPAQLDGHVIGLLASSFLFAEMMCRMPAGWFSDRLGRARVITVALLLAAPSFLASALAPHYRWIVPLRLWDGALAAMIWTSIYAIIGDAVPERSRANAMGVINMMYLLGLFLGSGVALGVNQVTGHPRFFLLISAGMAIITGVTALVYFSRHRTICLPCHENTSVESSRPVIPISRHVVLLAITFAQNFALTMVAPFMYRFATDSRAEGGLGLPLSHLALLVGLPILGVAVLAIPLSRVADAIGKLAAVRIAFTAVATTLWLFTMTRDVWAFSLVATVIGVSFSMAIPAWMAILSALSGSSTRGVTLGGYGTMQGIAAVLGPYVAGHFLWGRFGHASIFLASSLSLALAAVLAWTALREERITEQQVFTPTA